MAETFSDIKKFSDIVDELHRKSDEFLKELDRRVIEGMTGVMWGKLPKVPMETYKVRAFEIFGDWPFTGTYDYDNPNKEIPSQYVSYEKTLIPEEDFSAEHYNILVYQHITIERLQKAKGKVELLTDMAVDLIQRSESMLAYVSSVLFYAPTEQDGVIAMVTPSADTAFAPDTNVEIALDGDTSTYGAVGAFYLLPKATYDIRKASDGSLVGRVFVYNKSDDMKTVTLRNIGDASFTLAAGTKYYFTFVGWPYINGLGEVVRQTGTLHGIDKTTEEWFRAYRKNAAGAALSIEMVTNIQQELTRRARAKGYPDIDFSTVYTTEQQIQNIIADYQSLVNLNISPERKRLSWGGWSITVNNTEFVIDPMIPYGHAYFATFNRKYIRMYRDRTENIWRKVSPELGNLFFMDGKKPHVLTYPVTKRIGNFVPVPNVVGEIYNLGNDYNYGA